MPTIAEMNAAVRAKQEENDRLRQAVMQPVVAAPAQVAPTVRTIAQEQLPVPVNPAFEAKLAKAQSEAEALAAPAVNPAAFQAPVEAPAPVPGPAVMAPVAKTVTETSVGREAYAIQKKLDDISKREGQILEAQAGVAQKEGTETLKALESQDQELSRLQLQRAELTKDFDSQFAAESSRIQSARDTLSATPPESFWARRDTGDKILMALSIFAGAVGQGLTGARENAAIAAMNNAMAQDYKTQSDLVARKLAALDRSSLSLEEKRKSQQMLIDEMKARELATLDQTGRIIDRLKLSTKNENIKTNLDQAKLDLEKNMAEAQQRLDNQNRTVVETRMATGLSSATNSEVAPGTENAMGVMSSFTPEGMTSSAKPLKEAQAKSLGMLVKHEGTIKELEKLESSLTPSEFEALQNAAKQVAVRSESSTVPLIGGGIEAVSTALGGTPAEIYDRAIPGGKGSRYFALLRGFVDDQVRYDSGATLAPSELSREAVKAGITPGVGPENLDLAIKRRRDILKAHATMAGKPAPKFGASK